VWIIVVWLIMALVVASVAQTKGRSGLLWFAYGLILWPVALIAILVLAPNATKLEQRALRRPGNRKCPHCAEVIKAEASVCKHCGRDVAIVGAAS
jgi:hypothetical protein